MLQEIKTYKTADLVLQVSHKYNPTKLNLGEWDRYLDILCSNREFQKEAIYNSIIFLASGLYSNIDDLVRENYNNPKMVELKNRYQTFEDYEHHLQISGRLSASVDLATGTGKSFVMYGIAQIMLGLGLVDRVLVLCPSLTIENGLMDKFKKLSSDSALLKAIPENSKYKNPAIKTADVTIKEGDICIENIHAAYEKNKSSIKDSFSGQGLKTLVLNDEAHHIFNEITGRDKETQNLKKWKEFLLNSVYNFKYILNFTGTAYIKDEYFNDVIYRYSLRQAVNDSMVKMVDYVSKNDDADDKIKFQEIYDNHEANKYTYRKVKPLTILVTQDITKAKRLADSLSEFLQNKEHLSKKEIDKKVLIVTSHNEHKANVRKLKDVDKKSDPVEWIVSVSMLTEGWDVKNVFQIVPWEDRAFNSKLLIAQVLGRGLRIPEEYQTPQPRVRVFNHDSWSRNIRGLVDEILEQEMRLVSRPIETGDRAQFHFEVYQMDYEREQVEKDSKKKSDEFDYTKGYILLQSQVEESGKDTEYTNLAGNVSSKTTLISYDTYSVDEIVNNIYRVFKTIEWEGKILKLPESKYSKDNLPPKSEIKKLIRTSMDKAGILGDRLIDTNKNRIENSFSTLLRQSNKTTVYERKAKDPFKINTKGTSIESIAVGNLRHNSTVFYSSNYSTELDSETKDILDAIIEDQTFLKSASREINEYVFKTPFDLVFTNFEPERKFIEQLCKNENAKVIDAWIKSRDVGFYSIEYSITSIGGKHSKVQSYNPDFIIKITDKNITHFVVVEIKADNDVKPENKAKLKYGRQHFIDLNNELKNKKIKEIYHFYFLSPNSYHVFFDHLRNGNLIQNKFNSDLELKIDENEIEV